MLVFDYEQRGILDENFIAQAISKARAKIGFDKVLALSLRVADKQENIDCRVDLLAIVLEEVLIERVKY